MSSAAEDEEAATLETVKSVTLTQDSDGSIILHCPANGGCSIVNFPRFFFYTLSFYLHI